MKNNNKHYYVYIYLISILIITYILNKLLPLYADDWAYSFIYKTDDRVKNIGDIFYSQYLHYFAWGGRSVAHFIDQFLLFINKYLSDLLNSLVYLSLIYIISVISVKSFKLRNEFLVFIISFLLVLCLPLFTDTVLWKTGSSNYLWTTVIILLYLIPYIFNIYKLGKLKVIPLIMFLSGIIAGWTNENTGFSLIIAIFIFIYFYKRRYCKIPSWAIYGLIGVVIGFSMMILAPGNSVRSEFFKSDHSLLYNYSIRLYNIINQYLLYILPLTIIYLFIHTIYKLLIKNKDESSLFISYIFLLMAHLSILVMIGSPTFPARASFGAVVFMIMSISLLLPKIIYERKHLINKNFSLVFILLALASCFKYYTIFKDVSLLNKIVHKREIQINNSIKLGLYNIVLEEERLDLKTSTFTDFSNDVNYWLNIDFSKFRNINTIKINFNINKMAEIPNCPVCGMDNTYFDGTVHVCPDCSHEWNNHDKDGDSSESDNTPRDSNGSELLDGDAVTVIKDLKVKGSSMVIKRGTKVKSIRLTDVPEEVDCKIDGSSIVLKTCFLRKG